MASSLFQSSQHADMELSDDDDEGVGSPSIEVLEMPPPLPPDEEDDEDIQVNTGLSILWPTSSAVPTVSKRDKYY